MFDEAPPDGVGVDVADYAWHGLLTEDVPVESAAGLPESKDPTGWVFDTEAVQPLVVFRAFQVHTGGVADGAE